MNALLTLDTDLSICKTPAVFHVGDVIRKLRNSRGWSQTELGEKAALNKDTINRIESGEKPRQDSIERIAAALGVELHELYAARSGRGEVESREGEVVADRVGDYRRGDIAVIQEGEASPEGLAWDAETPPAREVERTSRPYDFRDPGAYAVVLRGDSMEPLLKRGMRLIVSPNIPVGDGDLAYAQLKSGERLVKIARKQNGGWLLSSANPAYEPRYVSGDQVEHIHRVAYVRFLK